MKKIRVFRVTLNDHGILIKWDFIDSHEAISFMKAAYNNTYSPKSVRYSLSIEEKEDDF